MPAAFLPLIQAFLPYGIQAVQAIVGIFSSTTAPTQAQWDALLASTQITARDQMLATLKTHGIDPTSPQGVALLALTPT